MARYRCYFVGRDGRLLGADSIESDNDEKAVAIASEEFFQRGHARGLEVWQNERAVYVKRPNAS